MPPLETEEEAEKGMPKRAKSSSSSSESDKERIEQRQKDAFEKKVKQLKNGKKKDESSGSDSENIGEGLRIMIPNQLLT